MTIDQNNHLHAEDAAEEITVDASITAEGDPREESPETFADFAVHPDIVASLSDAGILHPFPIQAMTLPVALSGHDIIGQAKTGTGKTLGFGIPVLQRVVAPGDEKFSALPTPGAPQALIIVPTRELAVQVANDVQTAARQRGARVTTIYGGRAFEPQIESLTKGTEVVVGTPGRLIDLYRQRHLNLKNVRIVVLDEADEMLDLGFLPDVETLLAATPEVRQTMLFSATMPGPVVAMARRYMTQPTHIRAADPDDEGVTKKDIRQLVYRAHNMDKDELVARVLQAEGRGRSIIFTKTKRTAARLSDELTARGFAAGAIHGDLGQGAREQALRAFRNNKVDILVATDVAARGIDVEDVTHVINFQCPEDEKTYLHRIGRTGRAGQKGTAVTLVDWDDVPRWSLIDKAIGLGVPNPEETYSSSAHLFADLNIPEGTKGRLPKNKRTHAGLAAEAIEDLGETGKRQQPQRGGRDRQSDGPARSDRPEAKSGGSRNRRRRGGRPDGGDQAAGRASEQKQEASGQGTEREEKASRPSRNRRRTRRRNGQVVKQESSAQAAPAQPAES
ncbi:DEAD/DEAH box helicase [Acaricomes phytoseiuli]|uniref:DEAD/DEAH box helicase n=1 Tax=Acaricomes phytoseiuli TaxID=291968 RepID=UPI0006884A84|nr:DEAD/DEAH box helicase [Acaricomes phytoseiuli]MCW1249038.1 DEAD/DEAH box helicase [Acaricomes phytoseiuli]